MANVLVVLIFIIIAILLCKMINLEVPVKPKLLARTGGSLDRDNYSYFYVRSHGPIVLNLTSLLGDTDLYISYTNAHPTFEPETYCQHSATCGEDILELPESSNTPLAIGVYGHGENNFFILEIYENPKEPSLYKPWIILEQEIISNKGAKEQSSGEDFSPSADSNSRKLVKKKKQNKSASNLLAIVDLGDSYDVMIKFVDPVDSSLF